MRRQKPRQREIDAPDLVEIDRIVERTQPPDFIGGQCERRIGTEMRPFLGREEPVGGVIGVAEVIERRAIRADAQFAVHASVLAAFSAMPDVAVRRFQFAHDVRQRNARDLQHNEQMEHQIGSLVGEILAIIGNRSDYGLDRLFAQLLGGFLLAARDKFRGPGFLGRRFRA